MEVFSFKRNSKFVLPEISLDAVKNILLFGNIRGIFGYKEDIEDSYTCSNECFERHMLFEEIVCKTSANICVVGPNGKNSPVKYIEEEILYICETRPDKNRYNIQKRYKKYIVKDNKEYFDFMDKIEEKNEKYDLVIMNPPYCGEKKGEHNEHLKFLNKALKCSKYVVSVEPITFLFRTKNNQPSYIEQETLLNIEKHGVFVEEIGGDEFDAILGNKVGVLKFDMTKKSDIIVNNKVYSSYTEITKFSHDNLLLAFNDIVSNLYDKDSLADHWSWKVHDKNNSKQIEQREKDSSSNMWFVNVAAIRGNKGTDDMFTIVPKDRMPEFGERTSDTYFNFDIKENALNFLNYVKTDFASCCIFLFKIGLNLGSSLHYVPWFDFSDPHFSKSPKEIDDYLFKKFNISDEIRNHIAEILPDYYNIR